MREITDRANVAINPPLAWALAFVVGLGIGYFYPLPFVPPSVPHVWVGVAVFAVGLLLALWAVVTIRRAGTQVDTAKTTTSIVVGGPFRYTRNPIYNGMFLGQVGLAIGFNNLWILVALMPFYFVIRYGVVAREETYLERKFGSVYLGYKSQVRRWL